MGQLLGPIPPPAAPVLLFGPAVPRSLFGKSHHFGVQKRESDNLRILQPPPLGIAGLQGQKSKGAVLFAFSKMAALEVEVAKSLNRRVVFSAPQNATIYAKDH